MSIFGGLSPVSLLATAALGPGGGMLAQLGQQVFTRMAMQAIQQMGSQLGLPQSQIDLAQSDFSFKAGDFDRGAKNLNQAIEQLGQETRASVRDIADAQRKANEDLTDLILQNSESQEQKEARAGKKGGSGGGSSAASGAGGWLRAMAEGLGKLLDASAAEMKDLAGRVSKEDPSTGTNFTVASSEFNMLMNSVSTALKTIGEAMGKMAARQ